MTSRSDIYDALAAALAYPAGDFCAKLDYWCGEMALAEGEVGVRFGEWADGVRGCSGEEREEMYTRAFDMDPKCTLELGWHLFGESYDRGTFLVWMRGRLRDLGLAESTDLPDHVRHVLAVLGRMEREDADKFSTACVLPALETVREGLRNKESRYVPLLDAICGWLELRHGAPNRDTRSLPILLQQHEELMRAEDT